MFKTTIYEIRSPLDLNTYSSYQGTISPLRGSFYFRDTCFHLSEINVKSELAISIRSVVF